MTGASEGIGRGYALEVCHTEINNTMQYMLVTVWRVIFRGVLIFIVFVVDLAIMKISHLLILMPMVIVCIVRVPDYGCGQNVMASWPTVLSVSK